MKPLKIALFLAITAIIFVVVLDHVRVADRTGQIEALRDSVKLRDRRIDSLRGRSIELAQELKLVLHWLAEDERKFKETREISEKWRIRYEKSKNNPLVRYRNHELDSVLQSLYPR